MRTYVDQLVAFGRRTRHLVLLSVLTGVLTGAAISLFEWITRDQLLLKLRDLPVGYEIAAPLVGLVLAAGILRWLGHGATPSTADEYIKNFHDQGQRLDLQPVPARIL